MCPRKIITHKIVFMWFNNLSTSTELQEFHYSQGKLQSATIQFFSLKNNSFISCAQDSQGGLSMSTTAWAYWLKPLLHGLSLRKSPIKNCNNIILGRVIIRIKHN